MKLNIGGDLFSMNARNRVLFFAVRVKHSFVKGNAPLLFAMEIIFAFHGVCCAWSARRQLPYNGDPRSKQGDQTWRRY